MDDPSHTRLALDAAGVRVEALTGMHLASLRYFDRAGLFVGELTQAWGEPPPEPGRAVLVAQGPDAQAILAWRSPTETLLLCSSAAAFADLEQRLAGAGDGCMVDQTCGIHVFRMQGGRAAEFFQRLGATALPAIGEARGARLAELLVFTACVRAGEYVMFVERVYAAHLAQWLRATAADFARA